MENGCQLKRRRSTGAFARKQNKSRREVNISPKAFSFRSTSYVPRPGTMHLPIYVEPRKRDPAVRTLSVFVKTSSLPSLRSMSHGTFDHVEEPASGSDSRHDESARFVRGLRRWVSVLSMQARWWPHPAGTRSRAQARKLTLHYVSVCRYRAPRVSAMIRIE